jgi:hypothetical protein
LATAGITCPNGAATAASFDPRTTVPAAFSTAQDLQLELRQQIRGIQETEPVERIKLMQDASASQRWLDTRWRIFRMMDAGDDLADLEEFGLARKPDGTFSPDLERFPEWLPSEERLILLVNGPFDGLSTALAARGFRPSDLAVLQDYLLSHDIERLLRDEGESLAASFQKYVRATGVKGRAASLSTLRVFQYQRLRIDSDVKRKWMAGLFQVLDEQRRRILASAIYEPTTQMTLSPSKDDEEKLVQMYLLIASGRDVSELVLGKAEDEK